MYCPNCKNKAMENSPTCYNCGYDLSKLRKMKLDDAEDDDRKHKFDDSILKRSDVKATLSYDPFKAKLKVHLLISALVLLCGIIIMIVMYTTDTFFAGGFNTFMSVVSILLMGIGFVYSLTCIFLFVR
jgi:hypothetical protein